MNAKLTRLAFVGATVATLTTGLLAGSAAAKGPDALTINPRTLEAQAPADFAPDEEVTLWYNLPDGTAVTFPEVWAAQDNGSLDVLIVPADYRAIPANAVNLVAQGVQSNQQAIFTFTSSPASAPAPVQLALDPASLETKAAAGSFVPGEEVVLWYNLPDGTAVTFAESTNALADGSLDWTLSASDYAAIPASAVNLVAQGIESGDQAICTFAH